MAEECTVSRITYINSPLHAAQDVLTITCQVKVCHWYSFDPEVSYSCAIMLQSLTIFQTFAEQATNLPQINFVSLKKSIYPILVNPGKDSNDGDNDDVDNDIPDGTENVEHQEEDVLFQGLEPIAATFANLELNMDSKVLASLLTDNPKLSQGSVEPQAKNIHVKAT